VVIPRFSAIVSLFLLEYVPVSGILFVDDQTSSRLTGNLVAAARVRRLQAPPFYRISLCRTPEQLHWHGQFVGTDVDGAAEEGTPYIPARGMRRIAFVPQP
jgi:hypothetical protein